MRTLYLECSAGASGDMLAGALVDLLPDPSGFIEEMNGIGLEDTVVSLGYREKMGIRCAGIVVEVHGEEESDHRHHDDGHGRRMSDVERSIGSLSVSDRVKDDAMAVYRLIAEAESRVHGKDVAQIHMHEVGMLDAVADIVCVCRLMELLDPDTVVSSPVRLGTGHVSCAHGVLPVPAPATVSILKDVPVYAGNIEGEFCTPTGAALLKHFADRFEHLPAMTFDRVGYGAGRKDFPIANILRAYLGHEARPMPEICEIVCNIDDMCPEDIASVMGSLLAGGALDAYTAPIVMKKGRLGSMLACICRHEDADRLSGIILKGTSTTGLRVFEGRRHEMTSSSRIEDTPYGAVRIKTSEGFGIVKEKPEFDDLERISGECGLSVRELRDLLRR